MSDTSPILSRATQFFHAEPEHRNEAFQSTLPLPYNEDDANVLEFAPIKNSGRTEKFTVDKRNKLSKPVEKFIQEIKTKFFFGFFESSSYVALSSNDEGT